MHVQKERDLVLGIKGERDTQSIIEEELGIKLNRTNRYDVFDYVDADCTVYVELKTRRVSKNSYPDTMVGMNKIIKGIALEKQGKKVYLVWRFTDSVCIYPLSEGVKKSWVRTGSRSDRGRVESSMNAFIPIDKLKEIDSF